ncbi:MAG: hypothetical protein U1E66_03400 [Rhodospirillales bacterium]
MTDTQRAWMRAALILAIGLAVGAAVRFLIVQVPALAWACGGAARPWWCPWREGLILALRYQAMGIVAVVAGAVALFGDRRGMARLAIGLGGAGLLLYAPELAGAGLLAGAMARLRA